MLSAMVRPGQPPALAAGEDRVLDRLRQRCNRAVDLLGGLHRQANGLLRRNDAPLREQRLIRQVAVPVGFVRRRYLPEAPVVEEELAAAVPEGEVGEGGRYRPA